MESRSAALILVCLNQLLWELRSLEHIERSAVERFTGNEDKDCVRSAKCGAFTTTRQGILVERSWEIFLIFERKINISLLVHTPECVLAGCLSTASAGSYQEANDGG